METQTFDCCQSQPMHYTDRITDFTLHVLLLSYHIIQVPWCKLTIILKQRTVISISNTNPYIGQTPESFIINLSGGVNLLAYVPTVIPNSLTVEMLGSQTNREQDLYRSLGDNKKNRCNNPSPGISNILFSSMWDAAKKVIILVVRPLRP